MTQYEESLINITRAAYGVCDHTDIIGMLKQLERDTSVIVAITHNRDDIINICITDNDDNEIIDTTVDTYVRPDFFKFAAEKLREQYPDSNKTPIDVSYVCDALEDLSDELLLEYRESDECRMAESNAELHQRRLSCYETNNKG